MGETAYMEQSIAAEKSLGNANLNAQYELYLKCIQTPVIAIDSEFNVIYLNQFGRKLLGLKKDALKDKKCYELFKTDDCHTEKCACARTMKTGKAETSITIARFGGGALPIQYTGAPVYNEQMTHVIGAVEVVTDITKIKDVISKVAEALGKLTDYQTNQELPTGPGGKEYIA